MFFKQQTYSQNIEIDELWFQNQQMNAHKELRAKQNDND